jgi:hypothetical protein
VYIPCIYKVYTWYIHGIYSDMYIFQEYPWYIPCIYMVYTWIYMVYIMCICSTWQLMLQRRTGSHSTGSTSNDIAWTNHNFNLSLFLRTFGILAPGEVDAQGDPGAVNNLKCHAWQARTWVKVSVDLGLCCHRVTFILAINLYHEAWLMSDWSSVQCHKHSNLRNWSGYEINRNKILNFSELNS